MPPAPQDAARQVKKITFTGRTAGVPALQIHIQTVYKQKEETALNCVLCLSGLFFLTGAFDLSSQGTGGFKELRGTRKPPRSFCWGRLGRSGRAGHRSHTWLWGSVRVPTSSRYRALALFDTYISCHFSLKALCKLFLQCGSRGQDTQLLAPSPFLSTPGRLSLVPGGGKPAASGGGRQNHTQLQVLPTDTVSYQQLGCAFSISPMQ